MPPADLRDIFAVVTADHQGLNNGIFYLRVCQDSIDLLTQVVDYPMTHPDVDLGWFGEQAAMDHVIHSLETRSKDEARSSGIAWAPRLWFNAFQWEHGFEGEPGDSIVHFAGLAETRLQHMTDWLVELRDHQAKWEMPLEDTSYGREISEFWKGVAAGEIDDR